MILHFFSINEEKHRDVAHLFLTSSQPPRSLRQEVSEILSENLEDLVSAKALAAYKKARVPLFVEHGGLYIDALNRFPGPLVKLFATRVGLNPLCRMIPDGAPRTAEFRNIACYCDGQMFKLYHGGVRGQIAPEVRGAGGIHWDPIFIPDGHTQTLGEMDRPDRLACLGAPGAVVQLGRDLGLLGAS